MTQESNARASKVQDGVFGLGTTSAGTGRGGRPLAPSVFPAQDAHRPTLHGTHGLVVAGHPIAAQVAAAVLELGGNAIDAAVAGGLAMNIVQADMCSFGGVAPILFKRAGEVSVQSIAGVGTWSATASIEGFVERHGYDMEPGVTPTIVPAAAAAWIAALRSGGTWSFSAAAKWAIELASDGFVVDAVVAAGLTVFGQTFKRWPSTVEIFWPNGAPPAVGTVIRQPRLAASMAMLCDAEASALEDGATRDAALVAAHRAFYEGPMAQSIVEFVVDNGGFLTVEDLANFEATITTAPQRKYRSTTVYSTPTWSQGPMMLQTLGVLEQFDLGAMPWGSADLLHLFAESLTLTAADRETYFGDPDCVDVPLDWLLSDERVIELAKRIDPKTSLPNLAPIGDGIPSTTHLSVIDNAGNVATTAPSDTLAFGPIAPELGFVVSPRGMQSRLDGNHAAALGPGRRPRITPAVAIACGDDGSTWALSCPGGDVIVQAMLQAFVAAVDHSMSPQAAVEAPRICALTFPNSFHPHRQIEGQLCVEGRIDEAVRVELEERGHLVQDWPDWEFDAGSVALVRRHADGTLDAGADPRRAAYGAGR